MSGPTVEIMRPAARAAAILRQEIREGVYGIGQRLAEERALAERFNLSRGTIRQALKTLEQERLIIRQQGRGTFVANPSYAPAGAAAGAALIAAMVWEKEFYFGAILRAASSQSAMRGYMLTTGSNLTAEEEERHVEAFIKNGVRGLIMTPRPKQSSATHETLRAAGIPVVMLDVMLPGTEEDFVSVDNRRGTVLATRHMLELGHRRLAYLGTNNPDDIPCRPERLGGFLDACGEAGIEVPRPWRLELAEDAYQAPLRSVLKGKDRPTAFVTYNDDCALRVIVTARELGLKVPADLSVSGFDDTSVARNCDVPITTIHPEFREVGIEAVNLLVEKMETPRERSTVNILVTPKLVARQSTGKAPKTT